VDHYAAVFLLGLAVFETVLCHLFEGGKISVSLAVFLTALGAIAVAVSLQIAFPWKLSLSAAALVVAAILAYVLQQPHIRRQEPSLSVPQLAVPGAFKPIPYGEWHRRAAIYILLAVAALALMGAILAAL
jgi:hypothetical protein